MPIFSSFDISFIFFDFTLIFMLSIIYADYFCRFDYFFAAIFDYFLCFHFAADFLFSLSMITFFAIFRVIIFA